MEPLTTEVYMSLQSEKTETHAVKSRGTFVFLEEKNRTASMVGVMRFVFSCSPCAHLREIAL